MNVKHYVGEYGSDIVLNAGEDISGASAVHIVGLKVMNNEAIDWTGAVYNDNYVKYTTVSGDFDKADIYRIQTKITATDGIWYGEVVDLVVYELND